MAKVINWVIYILKNPRTNEVRYVGWTSKKNPKVRLSMHRYEAVRHPHKTHKTAWLLSLVSIGLEPLMEIIESGTGNGWDEAERRWIAHYRANGARLVNATEGGEGCPGRIVSAASREKQKVSQKNRIYTPSPETRAKQSAVSKQRFAAMTPEERSAFTRKNSLKRWAKKTPEERIAWGKFIHEALDAKREHTPHVVSAETRANMSAAFKGRKLSAEARANIARAARNRRKKA
jgi:predicted GIY-YIG superfamily endonuclease